jgi:hypothetical protein
MPPPDKIRPLVNRRCSMAPECEFESTQEWAWLRHEEETGHQMEPMKPAPMPTWPTTRLPF